MKEGIEKNQTEKVNNKKEGDSLISVPERMKKIYKKIQEIKNKFFAQEGRYPCAEEVVKILEAEDKEWWETRHGKIDALVEIENYLMNSNEDDSKTVPFDENENLLNNDEEKLNNVDLESLKIDINRVLETLTPKEVYVIREYFNLENDNSIDGGRETLKKMSVEMTLPEIRVWQILQKAIQKLRHSKTSHLLKKYLG